MLIMKTLSVKKVNDSAITSDQRKNLRDSYITHKF